MSDYPMLISNKLHSFRNFIMQSYKFCLFIHTFIHNKLGIIKKGGICFQSAAFF